FSLVAAPDRGQRFELRDDVVALELALRILQQRFAQPALRRRRTIPRIRRRAIGGERVLAAAEAFIEPAHHDGELGLHPARYADGLKVVERCGRAVEIADLDGRTHFVHQRDALELDRQGRDRRLYALEALARPRPLALQRI